jgi:hypothetical protein
VAGPRWRLRHRLDFTGVPQLQLRAGLPAGDGSPRSGRRSFSDILEPEGRSTSSGAGRRSAHDGGPTRRPPASATGGLRRPERTDADPGTADPSASATAREPQSQRLFPRVEIVRPRQGASCAPSWTGPWRAPVSRSCNCTLCRRTSTSCWRTSPGSLATHRRQSRPRWRRGSAARVSQRASGQPHAMPGHRRPVDRRPLTSTSWPSGVRGGGRPQPSQGVILDGRRPRRTCVPPYRADPFVPGPCSERVRRPTTEPREDDRSEHRRPARPFASS